MELTQNQKYVVLFLLLILMSPFVYLFGFTHPIADDLGFGYQAKQAPLFDLLVHSYYHSNGLYAGNIIIYLFPFSLHEITEYRLFLLVCFIVFCASSFYFIKTVFPLLKLLDKTIITLFFALTFLGSTTDLSEAFYWQTSVVYYQLSLCFVLFYFGVLIQFFQKSYIFNKIIHQILLLFLLILIIGIKESIALIMGFISVLLFYYSQFKLKEYKLFFTIQLVVALIFIAMLVLAPGNNVRMAVYPNNKNFGYSLLYTFMQMGRFSITWLMALSGIFFVFIVAQLQSSAVQLIKKLDWKFVLLVFFCILFLCIFPAYWATGILGQHRTLNVASLFFVLFLLILALNKGEEINNYIRINLIKRISIFCFSFFLIGNGWVVVSDIFSGKVSSYNRQLTEREKLIFEKQTTKNLPLLKDAPKSLFVVDIQQDTTYWINQSYLLEIKKE